MVTSEARQTPSGARLNRGTEVSGESPGWPLEPLGNRRSRWMVATPLSEEEEGACAIVNSRIMGYRTRLIVHLVRRGSRLSAPLLFLGKSDEAIAKLNVIQVH